MQLYRFWLRFDDVQNIKYLKLLAKNANETIRLCLESSGTKCGTFHQYLPQISKTKVKLRVKVNIIKRKKMIITKQQQFNKHTPNQMLNCKHVVIRIIQSTGMLHYVRGNVHLINFKGIKIVHNQVYYHMIVDSHHTEWKCVMNNNGGQKLANWEDFMVNSGWVDGRQFHSFQQNRFECSAKTE